MKLKETEIVMGEGLRQKLIAKFIAAIENSITHTEVEYWERVNSELTADSCTTELSDEIINFVLKEVDKESCVKEKGKDLLYWKT